MPKRDTLDKVVGSYFAAITLRPFTYHGHTVDPKPLRLGPGILNGFTCNPYCGGCCPTFSLDYLPTEPHPYDLPARTVAFDGHDVTVYSDLQADNHGPRCRHLDPEKGLCGIHGRHPFSCDFELLRFIPRASYWTVNEQLFSRGWNMKRVDGGVGALCTIDAPTVEAVADVRRRLVRLVEWADHFRLTHRGRDLILYVDTFGHDPTKAPSVTI